MRLYTKEERSLSFRKIRENWFTLLKTSWNLCDNQFLLKLKNTFVLFFLYALQMCKLCWGLDLYLQSFWAHIAVVGWPMVFCYVSWAPLAFTWKSGWTFWPSKCCVHHVLHLGSSLMNVWRDSGFVQCVSYDFLGYIHQK